MSRSLERCRHPAADDRLLPPLARRRGPAVQIRSAAAGAARGAAHAGVHAPTLLGSVPAGGSPLVAGVRVMGLVLALLGRVVLLPGQTSPADSARALLNAAVNASATATP